MHEGPASILRLLDLATAEVRANLEQPKLSRRGALLGLSASIAAPFIIRTPGILMPVRNRILPPMYDEWGNRNWQAYPPSLKEVRQHRESLARERFIFHNPTAAGFNYTIAMGNAERRYEAMGLL